MKKLSVLLISLLFVGCASVTPQYDAKFGNSVSDIKALQTLNPTPSAVAAVGIDGKAAKAAHGRYEGTFKAPPPVTNVINIGGNISGSK